MKLHVANYWSVRTDAQQIRPDTVISIMDGAHLTPDLGLDTEQHLRLGFHDIDVPEAGKTPASPDHIEELIDFGRRQKAAGARSVLIHCGAGVRRSPAAAFIIAVTVRQEDPVRAAHILFREAPFADPNLLMVRHADGLAGFEGQMVKAVRTGRTSIAISGQQHSFAL